MKNLPYILMMLFCVSCKSNSAQMSDLEASNKAWISYRATINNSYSYINYSYSVFLTFSETKVTVQNGTVTGRSYTSGVYTLKGGTRVQRATKTWTEDSTTLNNHKEGAPPLTLDEVYERAQAYVSVDADRHYITFEKDATGLISSAGHTEKGCMDDCFTGFKIKSITRL